MGVALLTTLTHLKSSINHPEQGGNPLSLREYCVCFYVLRFVDSRDTFIDFGPEKWWVHQTGQDTPQRGRKSPADTDNLEQMLPGLGWRVIHKQLIQMHERRLLGAQCRSELFSAGWQIIDKLKVKRDDNLLHYFVI